MSNLFAMTLKEATAGIRQCDLAEEMAKLSRPKRDARSLVASLSRIQNGSQIPRSKTIDQIADAVGNINNSSESQKDTLRLRLKRAAADAERKRLHPECREALQKNPELDDYAIQNMLDHLGISVMRKIIDTDKKGQVVGEELLREATADLQQAAVEYSGGTVINAGRARIVIDGEVTPTQMQVLRNAAATVESVLALS